MKVVKICIGSACHLKGSYDVIEVFQQLVKDHNLEDQIELKAAFCLGHCTKAVSVQKWDGTILSVSKETANQIFRAEILSSL